MKKIIALSLITAGICTSAFANPVNTVKPVIQEAPPKVLSVFHVNERTLQEFTHGLHPDYVLEFPEKTTVPVAFFLKGDLVELVEHPGNFSQLKVNRTFYTKVKEGKVYFSTNLSEWKDFATFFSGATSFNLTLDEGLPVLNVGLEANIRAK